MTTTFKTISPVDGSVLVDRSFAKDAEIDRTLQLVHEEVNPWSETSLSDRMEIGTKVVQYFVENADEIGEELTWQMGRPIRYSPFELTKGFRERAEYMIDLAPRALDDIQIPGPGGFKKFIRKDPLGVIFVLAPWNYPYLTSVNVIIPAILAGNCVILKHATQTPLCAERYQKAFAYAGAPLGVFQHLHLSHDQVARVIGDPRIEYVAFTGSVIGGHAIQRALNNRFIGAGLELGGKDPAYVRKDADLDYSIENLVDGAFFNSGQSCCGIERIYAHQDIFDDFIDGFVHTVKDYVLGNPLNQSTTLGPMVSEKAADFVRNQEQEARSLGAIPLIDIHSAFPGDLGARYKPPQVYIKVDHTMRLMTEESFGPVVGIMSVRNDEEAIELMNDSDYGLTASLWTNDTERALQLGNKINTGTCFMNRCDYLDPALAWTGLKNSGRGCTLSVLGFEALTRPKSFHLKYF